MQVIFKTILKDGSTGFRYLLGTHLENPLWWGPWGKTESLTYIPRHAGWISQELSRYFLPWSPTYSPEIFLFFNLCLLYFKTTKTSKCCELLPPEHLWGMEKTWPLGRGTNHLSAGSHRAWSEAEVKLLTRLLRRHNPRLGLRSTQSLMDRREMRAATLICSHTVMTAFPTDFGFCLPGVLLMILTFSFFLPWLHNNQTTNKNE